MIDSNDIKTMLSYYLVGTEKSKNNPLTFPDENLLGAIRNIPESARQSTRKMAMEATKYSRIKCSNKKKKEHKELEKVTMIPYYLGDNLSSDNINETVESIVDLSSDKLQYDCHKSIVSEISN